MSHKFSDPYTDVTVEPMKVGDQEVAKVAVMVKDDDGERVIAAALSKDYNLIKNQIAADVSWDIMSRSEFKWKQLKIFFDGKKYAAYYITEDSIINIGNGDEHPLHLGFMTRNAYDGSGAFALEMFACNMSCTNQYISRNRFGFFQIYHTDSQQYLIDDAVQNVSVGANKLMEIAPMIKALRKEPLTIEHITAAKDKTDIPHTKWGDVIDRLAVENATLFGLFQALTYVTSHKMSGFNSISVANSVTDHILQ
ncbi:MAG: DUF932 domain-containing protein [Nanoarchaeota archaeon]|nr:DUF932 domain-containing protein [Nanoarchaeota archaeon]